MLSVSNDLFAPTEAAQTLRFNSGIRSAEGGANASFTECHKGQGFCGFFFSQNP
jgi:hypothetical protein